MNSCYELFFFSIYSYNLDNNRNNFNKFNKALGDDQVFLNCMPFVFRLEFLAHFLVHSFLFLCIKFCDVRK